MDSFDLRLWPPFRQTRKDTTPCLIDNVTIDSRSIHSPNTLFVALQGRRGDGHSFVGQAISVGGYALVAKNWTAPESIPEDKLIRVESPLEGLQDLAASYRKTFSELTLVAVAGSCGKTMLKDLLGHLFQQKGVYTSPESFNSQLGVALSILHMPRDTKIAFVELAATQPGEMGRLCAIANPTLVLVTNFFRKRLGTPETKEVVAQEILHLLESLPTTGAAIIEKDDRVDVSQVKASCFPWNETVSSLPSVTTLDRIGHEKIKISVEFPDNSVAVSSVIAGHPYCIELITLAIKAAWRLGLSSTPIIQSLQTYKPETMRTEIWKNKSGATFVNGTYCHNSLSFNSSLDELTAYVRSTASTQSGKTILVFGGLRREQDTPPAAKRLIDSMASHGITDVYAWPYTVASSLNAKTSSSIRIHAMSSLEEAIGTAKKSLTPFDTLLFKGPRKIPFDWIYEQLEESPPNSVACINLAAIRSNIELIRRKNPADTRIMVMVKALAYGTDDIRISQFLNTCNIDILGVSYVEEGVSMRKLGVRQSIFVINAAEYEMKKAAHWGLEVGVSSREQITAANDAAEALDVQIKVHLHVDTGMKRFGCHARDAHSLAQMIAQAPHLIFEGIFTHFCAADDPSQDTFTLSQANILSDIIDKLSACGINPTYRHACNSAAAIRFSFAQFNMIRIGLATYGFHTSFASTPLLELRPALSLFSHIVGFSDAEAGDTVSYGRTHTVKTSKARLAVLPIGYYDGLHRIYSGKAKVIIRGKEAPMVGRICMDYTMVDVTHIPEATTGDPALLFGEDEVGTYLSPESLASSGGSIVHELMTCLGPRIQRLFIYDESLLTR